MINTSLQAAFTTSLVDLNANWRRDIAAGFWCLSPYLPCACGGCNFWLQASSQNGMRSNAWSVISNTIVGLLHVMRKKP
jgi:hypothetical protein